MFGVGRAVPPPRQVRMMARMDGFNSSEDKGIDRETLRRAWQFARPYRGRLIASIGVILAAAAVGVLPPLVFKQLIDEAIPNRDLGLVNLLFVGAVVLALVNTALGLTSRWFSASIGEGLIHDLRVRLYEHVQRMPIGFFTRTQTGSLLSRLNTDVVGAQATVTTSATVVSDLVNLVITFAAMVFLSWRVTIVALVVVPLFVVLDRKVGRRLATLSRQRMDANAQMNTTMQERFNVAGALLVKLFGRPTDELTEFGRRAGGVRDAGIRMSVTNRFYYGALALTGTLGVAVVYWLGARSVIGGSLTLGTLTALAAYVTRLYEPLTSLAGVRADLATALVSFERCFEVLDAPMVITEKADAQPLPLPGRGRVEIDDVWFRYPAPAAMTIGSLATTTVATSDDQPSDWILQGVSLRAEAGQTIALVGPSGAGKTTLSSLVSRLYDVDRGAVRIDDKDIRDLTLQSLADTIGVVSQDTHLFHDTVGANLRYARPEATDAEVVAAAEAARIHHVIAALPEGYDTVVGERGYRLSGGEKQRLAIARVLLKGPAIVVLDEATAHLDSETEALVQQALGEALKGRTAIVIAHRLSTIRSADRIVVLEDGKVVEEGSHTDLVADGGRYAGLHDTQFAFSPE